MARPIIMTIDDEPHVLNAIARDLQAHYQKDYRILRAGSGNEALEAVQELKRRNDPVALFLVDQRMPSMSGVEFLREALKLYPETKKVLLTAYADTDAAIASINAIDLDYYLMKPWDPPEERLYPVLDDLLSDWLANVPVPYDGIRVAGTRWSPSSHYVKEFLARCQIPYQWLDIERDKEARELVESASGERPRLPVLFFPDGSTLVDPDLGALAAKVGMTTQARQPFYDLIIIGAGPAGLAGAVYGASEGLRTIVIEREAAGGQAGTSARIENYLGFPQGISGADLTRRATTQAQRLGAEIVTAQAVTGLRVEDPYRYVRLTDGTELSCHALLISTGVEVRRLGVPGIEPFVGGSIYYGAAASEAVYYEGRKVFVVGGANSAGQGAMFLSRYASKVVILFRGDSLDRSMSKYLIDQIEGTGNITVMFNTEITGVDGAGHLEAITIKNNKSGETETVPADAIFVYIGAVPSTGIVGELVERDEAGFIYTGQDLIRNGRRPKNWKPRRDPLLLETSVPGIFAAGDVRHGVIRRVASAVGQGAVAVSLIHKYLETV
ncbi:MAG: FAD-dependent oxidoreductase [Gammaproteobacteria bacterium]|nr:FAD-dependent oxidoreductase [Gammaproteobacteria bacterium]NIT63389.1 FAD-dependent oxidoreductase [Gammaproteobacteria bacterium]NIX10196.1 FAD-dependent oxidoreductase [Gammaproteobacteria bacterium]NIY31969.1 FAD-dependent oxidoreductase [Gammaproteobacteria bacterium]